jgi:ribosomal protein S18 acetylase RimI-like enzyme
VRAAGCAALRIYLDEEAGPLAAVLGRTRAMRTVEVGLVRRTDDPWKGGTVPAGLTLEPVGSADSWRAKLDFHRACPVGPDGHAAPAELWVEMERRRAGAGYLRPWLVRLDGTVCGTFALAGQGQLARLKNVVLHPRFRGRGLARHVVRLAAETAAAGGALGVGCFALERHHALAMYQALEFQPVIRQYEWVAPLGAPRPRHNHLMKAGS